MTLRRDARARAARRAKAANRSIPHVTREVYIARIKQSIGLVRRTMKNFFRLDIRKQLAMAVFHAITDVIIDLCFLDDGESLRTRSSAHRIETATVRPAIIVYAPATAR